MHRLDNPREIPGAGQLTTLGRSLLESYSPMASTYDEMRAADGRLRPHWRPFCALLEKLGHDDFAQRWEQAQSQLHEHGMAYGVYEGDEAESRRPWELDALPLLIPAAEWNAVSAALVQRGKLLNRILADLYGPQELLTAGLLPPEILFSHPCFQRPYHGYVPPRGVHLHVYAADLARSSSGDWWVLSDHTEAPSGLGHALENRIVLSRMLPDVFHACQIERLASYFIALRETLADLAPSRLPNPRIVVLSGGPGTPRFFEDTYLARYLGYMLVESSDLTVRQSRVMLKTLGGLLPVDVILRRTSSAGCDPLELNGRADGGIAGLLQALRAGQVTVANAPGAGLVESPAFLAFAPRLCERLLGESLMIPNIATWWCGDPASLQYVLGHLDELVIRSAFRRGGSELDGSRRLGRMTLDEIGNTLKASPRDFVAQERAARSTGPIWAAGQLSSARMALRAYLAASGDSYVAMQGALTRTSANAAPSEIWASLGEGSKDTWVVSENPVSQVSLLRPQGSGVRLRRSGAELPSRVAENLYWLGRYLERGDAFARLLRTLVGRLTSEMSADAMPEMPVLLRVLAKQGQIEPGYAVEGIRDALPMIGNALPLAVLGEQQEGNLRSTIKSLHRIAYQVRDRLSLDSWRIIRRVDSLLRAPSEADELEMSDMPTMLDRLIVSLASFSGLVMESMTRSLGWLFLDLGRRLERAQQTNALIASMLEQRHETPPQLLEALLEAADSLMTYRSRYLADLQVAAVLDLLLADETNPRSVAFQLVALAQHVDELPRDRSQPQLGEEQRLAITLLHDVRVADVTLLADQYSLGQWEPLGRILDEIDKGLPKLSDAVYHRYLVHAGPSWQLSDLQPASGS